MEGVSLRKHVIHSVGEVLGLLADVENGVVSGGAGRGLRWELV